MSLFRRTPEQKIERMKDRLDSASHHYEKWIYPFSSMHSDREQDKALDAVLDILVEAYALAEQYPEQEFEPADVLSYKMEQWLGWRAKEKGLKIALKDEDDE